MPSAAPDKRLRTIISFEREKQRLQASGSVSVPAPRARQADFVPGPPVAANPALGMFRTGPGGEFLEVSPALVAMFGYDREDELLAVPAGALYLDPAERNRWLALVDAHSGPVVFETAYLRRDGSILWAHHTCHAVRDDNGAVVSCEGILEDITARKRADDEIRTRNSLLEERLAEASEAACQANLELDSTRRELSRVYAEMEEFVRLVSHDLQEPLRMVSSFLQLISQRYRTRLDSEADKFIGYAVGGAARMKALITDLQGYLRIAPRPEAVQVADCRQILDDVLLDLRLAISESGASVTCGQLPVVSADPRQLRLVFRHLIENALKFRGDNPPRIRVWAECHGREWHFAVRDEGIGIAPEHSGRIFEIFKRLHLAAEYSGTGIGLAVCRKIVELHRGRIWVESQPGAGATFHFVLPDADAVPQPAAKPASSHAPARARAVL